MAIPRHLWPNYACHEMGGQAWHAAIVSTTSSSAEVKFTKARSQNGQPYEEVNLQHTHLCTILPGAVADAPQQGHVARRAVARRL